jgi:hypothetical protein
MCLTISCTIERKTEPACVCDTLKLKSQLSTVSVDSIKTANFYEVDSIENQQLWFTDIESIDSTHYTRLWDDYHENNFHASHKIFKDYYSKSPNTELAFQIGPAGPLWTYYTFVLKKRDCCFVFIRTSFAHARFRYKGYSLLSQQKVDSLIDFVKTLDKTEVDEQAYLMTASFVDNRNDEMFDVAIEHVSIDDHKNLPPDSAVIKFLNFVDAKIRWTETYPLEPEEVRPKLYDEFSISGSYIIESEQGDFNAKVTVEKKETYLNYSWAITSEKGKLLAAKSSTIDFKQIKQNTDQFDFVKKHVVKEIREYKIRNKKIVIEIREPG